MTIEELHGAARSAFQAADYNKFSKIIDQICTKFPSETAVLDKWFRAAAQHADNEQLLLVADRIAVTLGEKNIRVRRYIEETGRKSLGNIIEALARGSRVGETGPGNAGKSRVKAPVADPVEPPAIDRWMFAEPGNLANAFGSKSAREFSEQILGGGAEGFVGDEQGARAGNHNSPMEVATPEAYADLIFEIVSRSSHSSLREAALQLSRYTFVSGAADEEIAIAVARLFALASSSADARAFSKCLRLSVGITQGSATALFGALTRSASALSAVKRRYVFAYIELLLRLDGETIENSPNANERWLQLIHDIADWSEHDLYILQNVPYGLLPLPENLAEALLLNSSFKRLAFGEIHGGAPAFVRSWAAQCVSRAGLSGAVAASLNAVLLSHDSSDASEAIDRVIAGADNPAAGRQLSPLMSYFLRRSDEVGRLNELVPFFVACVERDSADANLILQTLSKCGARQALLEFVSALAASNDSWAAEIEALGPTKLFDTSDVDDAENVLIISDLELSARQWRQFELGTNNTVYAMYGGAPAVDEQLSNFTFIDGQSLNDDQRFIREITNVSDVLAFSLSTKFRQRIKDLRLQEVFADLRTALFASVRARIIGLLRRYSIMDAWRAHADERFDRIVLVTTTPSMLASFEKAARDPALKSKLEVCFLPKKRGAGAAFLNSLSAFKRDVATRIDDAVEDGGVSPLRPFNAPEPFDSELRTLYENLPVGFDPPWVDRQVVFMNRMAAKTVPGATVPIIEKLLESQDICLFDIQSSKDETVALNIPAHLVSRLHRISVRDLRAVAAGSVPEGPDPVRAWFDHEFDAMGRSLLGARYVKYFDILRQTGVGFDMANFAAVMSLRKNLDCAWSRAKDGVAIVCPGRSVEAYCAQEMASRRGFLSVDIVNAWLSDQFTYATPRGDVVTAIDDWTAKLLEGYFRIEPQSVQKVGVPRYDGLYARAADMDRSALQRHFELNDRIPTICVALQPISLDINREIIGGVMDALNAGTRANVILKPHPREPDARIAAYAQMVDQAAAPDGAEVKIFPQANIIEVLVASDLCVTAFSNVGVEAALCERDTVLCQFPGMDTPIRLDEMGLGFPTATREELCKAVIDIFAGGPTREQIRRLRAEFFSLNQHFISSSSTEEIVKLLDRKDLVGVGAGRSLLPEEKFL